MESNIYSVFFSNAGKFQLKTDFRSLAEADIFLNSRLFEHLYTFNFMLLNGVTLLRGIPKEINRKFFLDSMNSAIDIPVEEHIAIDHDLFR